MTLNQLLVAMKDNVNTNICIVESDGTKLITFNAGGYASVESDLLARQVSTVSINTMALVTIKLTAVGG